MYEVVTGAGKTVIATNLTLRKARNMVRKAWDKERDVLYYRKVGTVEPLYIAT